MDAVVTLELTSPALAGIADREVVQRRGDATRLLLQELRSAFAAPVTLALAVDRGTVLAKAAEAGRDDAVPEITVGVAFTLLADGRVRDVRVTAASPAPALDSALAGAIARAARAGALSGLAPELGGDSLLAEVATTVDAQGIQPGTPLMRVRLPRYVVTPPTLLPPLPSPEYPMVARRAGVTDSVALRFVVDTLGRVDVASLSVIAGTYRDFVKAVLTVLPRMRFEPARSADCAIAFRVVMPFTFSLGRSSDA